MEWESPITLIEKITSDLTSKYDEDLGKMVVSAVQQVGITVDKEKLLELLAKDKPARIYPHTSLNGMTRYVCPRCEMTVEHLDDKYCRECGQRFEEWI